MLLLYGFLALCSLAGISAQCEDMESIHHFNQARYIGTWYENGMVDKRRESCVKIDWFATPDGGLGINFSALFVDWNRMINGSRRVELYDATQPGRFKIFSKNSRDGEDRRILGTDYTSYSVEYGCNYSEQHVHIMTRKIDPPQSVIDKAMKVIRNHGITINRYAPTDQSCWEPEEIIEEKKPKKNFSVEIEVIV